MSIKMPRVGIGYDLHKFEGSGPIMLGGVSVPCDFGVKAHSDGDVIIHALCDAIYGALAIGDIGEHFPDTAPEYKDAQSKDFLAHAVNEIAKTNYKIANVDVTVIAQTPKLKPHKINIRNNLCELLNITENQVNIKAKTNEGLDAIGEKRAIAAQVVVMFY